MSKTLVQPEATEAAVSAGSPVPLPQEGWRKKFCFIRTTLHVRRVGKHFIDDPTLARLAMLRDELGTGPLRLPEDSKIAAFVEMLLDKYDGRYDYITYLALPLLGLPITQRSFEAEEAMSDSRHRVSLLIADALAFERAVERGENDFLPLQKPDTDRLNRRYRHGLLSLSRILSGTATPLSPPPARDLIERLLVDGACEPIIKAATPEERDRLMTSMLPVYTCHDEYLFIRILQSFETIFAWSGVLIEKAIGACQDGRGEELSYAEAARVLLDEGLILFAMLGTMQRESFQTFRDYTEGASAIQSRSYKRLEALCRAPSGDRLESPAFNSVPAVKEEVFAMRASGRPTLYDAWRQLRALSGARAEALRECMRGLEFTLHKWKNGHYGMAVKMLGEKTGTGYTEGPGYLKKVKDIPLFGGLSNDHL